MGGGNLETRVVQGEGGGVDGGGFGGVLTVNLHCIQTKLSCFYSSVHHVYSAEISVSTLSTIYYSLTREVQ